MVSLVNNYSDNVFPSICKEFQLPVPITGIKIAAVAQFHIAGTYYAYHHRIIRDIYRDTYDVASLQKALEEWNKVVQYFPDRYVRNNEGIAITEWQEIIYPAYFTIAQIYSRLGQFDKAEVIADEILEKGPALDFEYGSINNVYVGAYFIKATNASKRKDYQGTIGYLQKVATQYPKTERGAFYNSIALAKELLSKQDALKFVEDLATNDAYKISVSTYTLIYASILEAGLLCDMNRIEEGRLVFKKVFDQHPKEVFMLLVSRETNIQEYFTTANAPLRAYYVLLAKERLPDYMLPWGK